MSSKNSTKEPEPKKQVRYGGRDIKLRTRKNESGEAVVESYFGKAKNTLVTLERDGMLYYGISRCNVKSGDDFVKSRGREIAENRARNVFDEYQTKFSSGFKMLSSGLIKEEELPWLVEYFHSIGTKNFNPVGLTHFKVKGQYRNEVQVASGEKESIKKTLGSLFPGFKARKIS